MTQENVFLNSQIILSLFCIFLGIVLCVRFSSAFVLCLKFNQMAKSFFGSSVHPIK